ncbi:MAG: hypothetical protein H8D97_00130 [Proteobacteria bacterium]|nr:hypothetical protein [Pseudomonadota bacterium]
MINWEEDRMYFMGLEEVPKPFLKDEKLKNLPKKDEKLKNLPKKEVDELENVIRLFEGNDL